MAYSFQEIVTLSQTKTGKEIAYMLGVVQPETSNITEERYLNNEGGRIIRAARDQVEAGNGHGLYGEKKARKSGNGKAAPDPLFTLDDEIKFAAILAAKKSGLDENANCIRVAIESGNSKVLAFLEFALSTEQREILEKAIGVLTPAEREAKRREDLIADIRMAVLKASRLDSMMRDLEAAGFAVEAPLWFADVGKIDIDLLPTKTTPELEALASKFA